MQLDKRIDQPELCLAQSHRGTQRKLLSQGHLWTAPCAQPEQGGGFMLSMKTRAKESLTNKRKVNTPSKLGAVFVVGLCLLTWAFIGFEGYADEGEEEEKVIDPQQNFIGFHDSSSPRFKKSCTDCHANVLTEESLNPDISPAHVAMFEYAAGKPRSDKQCLWCHRGNVDLTPGRQSAEKSKGNLRKHVNVALCTMCHGPTGPATQFYRVGLPSLVTDGPPLYDLVCAGCHRDLTNSEVEGKSANKIREAINEDKGGMRPLAVLSSGQIDAIAAALGGQTGDGGGEDEDEERASGRRRRRR